MLSVPKFVVVTRELVGVMEATSVAEVCSVVAASVLVLDPVTMVVVEPFVDATFEVNVIIGVEETVVCTVDDSTDVIRAVLVLDPVDAEMDGEG